jgi:hypothetical protein
VTNDAPNPFDDDRPLKSRADTWMLFIGQPYVRETLVVIGLVLLLHWRPKR